ncbi:hypothetical protein ACFWPU_01500 [Streptomyces sp. NPDC058471]|uniref:hypothetical protein n=1 Tax=Streptomyces sp. NPDC058471 TaxID=3346516 RepID=UPI003645FDC9
MDRHAHVLSGTSDEAARHYERALSALLFFRGEVADEAQAMVAASPDSAMAHVFGAYLGLLGTEEKDAAAARRSFSAFRGAVDPAGLSPREQMHAAAAETWLEGNMLRAGEILGEISTESPRDALALAVGHQIDFFTGDAQRLRDRIGGALSSWDGDDPHFGPLLGMYAFGLEEAGHYGHAEEVGLQAVERHPRDVWGIHAVVHTYEMRGLFGEGIRYMDARTEDWTDGNYLSVHNAWHYALYALEAAASNASSASTTTLSTTRRRTPSPWNSWMPPPCCGGFSWSTSTSSPVGLPSPRLGPGVGTAPTTPSTMSTP